MKFLEKVILKLDPDFKKLYTKEKKRNYLTISGHVLLSFWLADKFVNSLLPFFVLILVLVINITVLLTVETKAICYTVFFLTLPLITVTGIVVAIIRYKVKRKKQDRIQTRKWLWNKIQNLWLWNGQVVSLKDWLYMRKEDIALYRWLRSNSCNHHCYYATFQLANTLQNPDIKILWLTIIDYNKRYGHAVLEKNGMIYDTNKRRTYEKKIYFKAQEAKLFKEFPIEVYQRASGPTKLGWIEFGEWCQRHGVIRDT